jgi:hypothetical protein
MFLSIFNWMLAHVPGFMRPAVGWLIDGLRSLTNYVSQRWTSLGQVAQFWRARVSYWYHRMLDFAVTFTTFTLWLVVVYVPAQVAARAAQLAVYAQTLVGQALAYTRAGLAALGDLVARATANLLGLLTGLRDWAVHWIDKLIDGLGTLMRALVHVLSGPDALAEWLAAAMWRALGRLLYSQRERIVMWLTRESVAFTRWLALEVENIIVRWL